MRLMLAVDINHGSLEPLINEAVLWAQRLDAKLDLAFVGVHTWNLGSAADPEIKALIQRETERARTHEVEQLQEWMLTVPEDYRGQAIVLSGPPVQALVDGSRDHSALLVGTHGRTGVSRFWLGSVSEQLVRRSECPVLVLKLYQQD